MSETEALLARMARREAAASFLVSDVMLRAPWAQFDARELEPGRPALQVHVVRCSECGAGLGCPDEYLRSLPLWFAPCDLLISPAGGSEVGDVRLTILGCEALPVRSFLLVAAAAARAACAQVAVHSRAAAWQEAGGSRDDTDGQVAFLDAAEAWSQALLPNARSIGGCPDRTVPLRVLPSSTRLIAHPGGPNGLGVPASHYAWPHPATGADQIQRLYTSVRLQEAARLLRAELAARAPTARPGWRPPSVPD